MADPNDLSQIGPNGGVASNPNLMSNFMALMPGQQGTQPMQLPGASGLGSIGFGGAGGAGAQTGFNTGFGANIGTGQLALGGLSTLGNLWTAWNANQLAQQSFQFNKTLASDNYTNQAASYNTNLNDIASARAKMENQTPAQEQTYVNANQLKTTV